MAAGKPHAQNEHAGTVERIVRMHALAGLRMQYPQASEAELRRKLADLLPGKDLAHRVYAENSHAQ